MTKRIPVLVDADDPISRAGIATQLRGHLEVRVVDDGDADGAAVTVLVTDEVDEEAIRKVRAAGRTGCGGVVLVATRVEDGPLLAAVEAGAKALIRRSEATTNTLVHAVASAAAGEGRVPPDLLGRLLAQVGRLQRQILEPRGFTLAGLAQREIDVLRLVSEGLSTREIARRLSYSERTIKNIIHEVTTRLHLRNRSHAVAYAMREGLI